jgi:WD40 repeat protein
MTQIKKIHTCTGHRAAIYCLAPGRDDRHFLTAGGDGWVVEWNLDDLETGRLIANTETQIFSLCVLPDTAQLVAGNMNGGVHWMLRDQPERNRNVLHHHKGVYDMLALGEHLFTAGGDGIFTRWDIETARTLESIQLSNQALRAIAYSATRHEIAIGASDHNIYFLDATTLELKYTIPGAHTNSVFTLAWSPDSQLLLSGGRDAWLRTWEASTVNSQQSTVNGQQSTVNGQRSMVNSQQSTANRLKEAAHLFTINHITYSPDGQLFATASRDKTIKIWDAQTFQLLKVIDVIRYGGHINSVNRLLWLPECLISASDDRSAMVWTVDY